MRVLLGLVALVGCDRVFGLKSGDVPPDADTTTTGCMDEPSDPLHYRFITSVTMYQNSVQICQALDMVSVTFDDEAELSARQSLASNYWVGLTRAGNGSDFATADNCPAQLPWGPGQPTDVTSGSCVVIASDLHYYVANCFGQANSYCKTRPVSAACIARNARRDYTLPVGTTMQQQAQAKATCIAGGAHLVEINSADEVTAVETFIASHGGGAMPYWVAGEYTAPDFSPTTTGCEVVFSWSTNEPKSTDQAHNCVLHTPGVGDGLVHCDVTALVVCEPD